MGAIRNFPTCTLTPNMWDFIKISWSKAANGLDRMVNGGGAEVRRRDGMRTPLPSILSRRVEVANANRLHLESQGRRPGENIHGKRLSSV